MSSFVTKMGMKVKIAVWVPEAHDFTCDYMCYRLTFLWTLLDTRMKMESFSLDFWHEVFYKNHDYWDMWWWDIDSQSVSQSPVAWYRRVGYIGAGCWWLTGTCTTRLAWAAIDLESAGRALGSSKRSLERYLDHLDGLWTERVGKWLWADARTQTDPHIRSDTWKFFVCNFLSR